MKTWKKIARLLVPVFVLLPTAALIAVQIPAVQTAVLGRVTSILSENLDGEVRVGRVLLSYPNNVILKDVDVIRCSDDTLMHIGKVLVSLKTASLLFSKEARIRRVSIENGRIAIRDTGDGTTNLAALLAPLTNRPEPENEASSGLPWESIRAGRLTIRHIDFSTDSLYLQDINLTARDIHYGKTASARIENLTLREESRELHVEQCSGNVTLDSTGIHVKNLRASDRHSNVKADADLRFTDFNDFSHFLNRVSLDVRLHDAFFDTRTLASITKTAVPALGLWLDGRVRGTVSNLRTDLLHVESASQETFLDLKFRMRGLPDLERTRIDAEILRSSTHTADLADILTALQPDFDGTGLSRLAPGEELALTATAEGTLAELKVAGMLEAGTLGTARVDATLGYRADSLQIDGNAATASLQLGRILGNKSLGPLTCQADLSLTSFPEGLSAAVKPLHIRNFTFNGYAYRDIVASGIFRDGLVRADIISHDPNLRLVARGDILPGEKGEESRYKIDLDLDHAALGVLHFDKRDSTSLSLSLDADITRTPQGAFLGQAEIRSLQATLKDRIFDIGDLSLTSSLLDDRYGLSFESAVARASYEGNLFITDFVSRAIRIIGAETLSHLPGRTPAHKDSVPHPEDFGSLQLRTLALQPLLDFFSPGLYVSRESNVGITLLNDEIVGTIASELTAFGDNILHNAQGRFFTEGKRLHADFDVEQLQAGSLLAENVTLDALADSSLVSLKAGFRNEDGSGHRADLHAQVSFPDPQQETACLLRVDLRPSTLAVAGNEWEIVPATLSYENGARFRIDRFALFSGEQSLMADGVIGSGMTDTIRVLLNDFDIGMANAFLQVPLNLQGLLTGQGEAFALLGPKKGILLNLRGLQISAAGIDIGDLQIESKWDDPGKQFRFLVDNTLEGRHPLSATAFLRPSDSQAGLDLRLDRLPIGMFEPFLDDLVSDVSGSVSGHIKASGPLGKLSVESENAHLNLLKFKLLFTQVDYMADGPFTIGNTGITFDGITLIDPYGHLGSLTGGIPYDHFNDLRFNARIELNNMLALNTTSRDNDTFYGKAFADGTVRLSGPLNKIRLGMNVTPKQHTAIHIPLGNSARESQSLLTFIGNEEQRIGLYDSLLLARKRVKSKNSGGGSDLAVDLRIKATPDAEILLEIDKSTGDILKARGNGPINITVDGGNFDIKGDYRVDSGSYHFGMLGFTSRDFSINPGGSISFVGDVMQSNLDLTATYRTKASISPLIADSTAVSTRRTVECGIGLTGKLANPEIKFNIDIPDLDPATQGHVRSALNTEDKRMKQALALLVSGGFVPDQKSGIVNSTTLLYSNASEIMASQLNNILRQLNIPLDLGFNYQPSENGRNIFDVAVSTQLFNNRVSINGNIGNRQYISSNTSDIVGDLDIEIKLNRQGQLRLTLFSHSADQYSSYLDQSQRNGAGIVYREDFNTIGELWRRIFHIKRNERQTSSDSDPAGRPRPE